ncbi:MAG TPA: plasmid segregation centromere-binding protein ParR [Candidatus Mediterraneibacter stercorigallinarum]|uniref:Plasmid segregation centromere-binding protein ParR n=1 Tax=Candidatus Mediterraneibacter stercorigallinarum TaxID=2838686 RepID=A0A9D2IKD7_9FIRM|nr:plasmid segregation centromere-binding protein ParR [Candidatus Mediterraneibacter stercorigallinarum]
MKRPVFSFRPNLKNPDHRKAWETLLDVPEREKTAYLVHAILAYEQTAALEDVIRRAVREEMQGMYIQADTEKSEQTDTDNVPEEMMEFLSMLQEE